MASTPPRVRPPLKQLGELLQENQDPFVLKIYCSERSYSKRRLYSESCFGCCYDNLSMAMKTPKSPFLSRKLKEIYEKLALINGKPKVEKFDEKNGRIWATEISKNGREVEETEELSSVSSTTEFYSCTDSDGEEGSISAIKDHSISKSCNFKESQVESSSL